MSHGTDSHRTTVDGVQATWLVDGRRPVVSFIDDPERDEPARRWPDLPLPDFRSGHIAFGPGDFPTLDVLRVQLPEYARLWDAVDEAYRSSMAGTANQSEESR